MISVQYSFVEYDCTTPRECTVDTRRVQDEFQEGAGHKIGLLGLKPPLTFHGLRKNATGALLEAGCTPEEVKSITGHRTTQMIDKYAIGVRQKRMAERVKNIWGKKKQ